MASQPPQSPADPDAPHKPASPIPAPSDEPRAEPDLDEPAPETNAPQDRPVWPMSPED
jgi:hypothetical protein